MRPCPQTTRAALTALALTIGVASGCEPRSDTPAAHDGPRIVSLTPALTEIVVALGRGDRLVGVTRHGAVDGVPLVGDMRPDRERVLAARPDLVLIARYGFNRADIEALRADGHTVLDLPLETFEGYREALRTLGERLDARAAAGAQVAALDAAVGAARAARPTDPPGVLLVFEVSGGHVYTTGGGDHLAELLETVGARNVAAGGPLTTRLPLERVLALRPDLIVHTNRSDRFPDDATALAWWRRAVGDVPATREGHVVVWPDDSLARLGPQLPPAILKMSALVREVAR